MHARTVWVKAPRSGQLSCSGACLVVVPTQEAGITSPVVVVALVVEVASEEVSAVLEAEVSVVAEPAEVGE